jgi:transketolase
MELAQKDSNVLYLTADSGEGGLDLMFRRNFPERTFDFGIAENNMVAAAAGLATAGKIPFVYTAAPFLVYRSYEFIRDDLCLQNLPVKLVGTGSGLSVGALGPTHHTTEDISALRCLPGLKILSPATPKQAYESMKIAYNLQGPVYIRLGMSKEREFFDEDYTIPQSGMDILAQGQDIVIFSTGAILEEVMESAEMLNKQGISVTVVNIFSIKPFDVEMAVSLMQNKQLVCTVEEHNTIGGIGSIISDTLVDNNISIPVLKIGLNDNFAKGYGVSRQVRIENGLDALSIAEKLQRYMYERVQI